MLLINHMIQLASIKSILSPIDSILWIICIYLYVPPLSYSYDSYLRDIFTLNFVWKYGILSQIFMLKNILFNFTVWGFFKMVCTVCYLLRLAFFLSTVCLPCRFIHAAVYTNICFFCLLLYNNSLHNILSMEI